MLIGRYNADFKDGKTTANALITVKARTQGGKNIYSIELEELQNKRFSSPSGEGAALKSFDNSTAKSVAPNKTDKIVPQARLNPAETPAQKAKNEINRQNRARLKAGKPELTAKQKQNITKEIFSQELTSKAKTLKTEAIKPYRAKGWDNVDKAQITHTASAAEFDDFIKKAWSNDPKQYAKMPNAIRVGTLPKPITLAINASGGDVYLTKKAAIHSRTIRKKQYGHDIDPAEAKGVQGAINNAKEVYGDKNGNFIIPFKSKQNGKVNTIALVSDDHGNLIITLNKINIGDLNGFKRIK